MQTGRKEKHISKDKMNRKFCDLYNEHMKNKICKRK